MYEVFVCDLGEDCRLLCRGLALEVCAVICDCFIVWGGLAVCDLARSE